MSDALFFSITIVLFVIFSLWYLYFRTIDLITDPIIYKIKEDLKKLNEPKVDSLQFFSGSWSKTIGKQKIVLCVRDPKTEEYYKYNFLMKVAIHELAHALNPKISFTDKDHHDEQWRFIYNDLIARAIRIGIYHDGEIEIENYCKG